MSTVAHRLPRAIRRAARVALPALWRLALWPLVKVGAYTFALIAITQASFDMSNALLAQAKPTWQAYLAATSVSAFFFGTSMTVLLALAGSVRLSKTAIAVTCAFWTTMGFMSARFLAHAQVEWQSVSDSSAWIGFPILAGLAVWSRSRGVIIQPRVAATPAEDTRGATR